MLLCPASSPFRLPDEIYETLVLEIALLLVNKYFLKDNIMAKILNVVSILNSIQKLLGLITNLYNALHTNF